MDFSIKQYHLLLKSIQRQGFFFQSFSDFIQLPKPKVILLRHDVDLLPAHSLLFAEIQADSGIRGTYYFRAVPESWDEDIILEISDLGHEIGYHYETMDTENGDIDRAWNQFRYHLDELRRLVEVKTICMHGSPQSRYDNRALWGKYNYNSLGIIGEPYYDINFDEVFYLTDTGRRWDGWKVSIRDKVSQQDEWAKKDLVFHSTNDVINSLEENRFPNLAMFTFHPQRWHNNILFLIKEFVYQNIKNQVKKAILYRNKIRKIS